MISRSDKRKEKTLRFRNLVSFHIKLIRTIACGFIK